MTRVGDSALVLADIHGNVEALRAVLADIAGIAGSGDTARQTVVVAGDLVLDGPRPAEALAAVRAITDALAAVVLGGNTDRYVATQPERSEAVRWAREHIGPDGLAYLGYLDTACRITPRGGTSPADDLLIVHASPADDETAVIAAPDGFGGFAVTPEQTAGRLRGGAQAQLILAGHVHFASLGEVAGQRFGTVGSVGFPDDGDPRAAYARCTWTGRGWQVEHRRVAYDYPQVAGDLRDCGAPFAESSAQRLLQARFVDRAP